MIKRNITLEDNIHNLEAHALDRKAIEDHVDVLEEEMRRKLHASRITTEEERYQEEETNLQEDWYY